jgi:protein-tyrosine phosphatase
MTPEINVTRLDDLSLTRTGNDSVRIFWKIRGKILKIAIYSRQPADEIEHHFSAAGVKENTSTNFSDLDPDTRYYFEVVSDSGLKITISERRVPLEGSVNFRDLGGYETVDGRRVKWGLVFRSDNLGRLTDRDVAFLQRMGIRLVCDFRTPAEAEKLPDRFPRDGHAKYLHLPIRHGEFDPADTFERIQKGDIEWMTEEFMIKGYIKNIDNFAPVWSTLFNCLSDRSSRPIVFHCTGGKDRAGVCAALILLTLGVPEETVITDHGLSNVYIAGVLEKIYARIQSAGVDPRQVSSYFTAPKNAIVAFIDHIRQTYGSAAGYLRKKAGVEQKVIDQLKKDLLE